jgi:hypothetical protein
MTDVRQWVYNLPVRLDARIERRDEWHYQMQVYQHQIDGQIEGEENVKNRILREQEYRSVLENTVFSLCPSGSGPNSIRLWESLGMGCIPVILADQLRLMGDASLWTAAAVMIPENQQSVNELPGILSEIRINKNLLDNKRMAVYELWNKYIKNGYDYINA